MDKLTKREQEVYDLLILGCSYKDICRELYISNTTLKTHVVKIFRKKVVNSLPELLSIEIEELKSSIAPLKEKIIKQSNVIESYKFKLKSLSNKFSELKELYNGQ